jgi:acyl-CoA dehydrogenase
MEEEVLVSMDLCRAAPVFRSNTGTNKGMGSQGIVIDGTSQIQQIGDGPQPDS